VKWIGHGNQFCAKAKATKTFYMKVNAIVFDSFVCECKTKSNQQSQLNYKQINNIKSQITDTQYLPVELRLIEVEWCRLPRGEKLATASFAEKNPTHTTPPNHRVIMLGTNAYVKSLSLEILWTA